MASVKYSHIIFDWDGTLMDSAAKIVNCMQKAAIASNLPIPSSSDVKNIIGISLRPAIQTLFDIELSKANEVAEHYKHIFVSADKTPCFLFPKVKDTLSVLSSNITLAVATGKARRGLERALDTSKTRSFFQDTICSDESESKPSPDMLIQLLERWNVESSQVLMVGDTEYDLQMAKAIDMPRIGVSYGVHSASRLERFKPIAILDCISQLPPLVDSDLTES